MSDFLKQMRDAVPSSKEIKKRQWAFAPYDRLNDRIAPLSGWKAEETGIVLVESYQKGQSRPYHHKKVLLLLANQRHFALEQQRRGAAVLFLSAQESYGEQLAAAQKKLSLPTIQVATPAEREMRKDLERGEKDGLKLQYVEDTAWVSTAEDWQTVFGKQRDGRQFRMDSFYRHMRRKSGLLMEGAQFAGGQLSFDEDNRQPWRGKVPVPVRPGFAPDEITLGLIEMIERVNPVGFGSHEGFDLPVTAEQAQQAWRFALEKLLPHFGPWEDAMSVEEPVLFHSALSALMNLSRLLPAEVVADVEQAYREKRIPLASAEGFIRQIIGWREYMRHIHAATDGYRTLDQKPDPPTNRTANQYSPLLVKEILSAGSDRPAMPSALDAHLPLPPVYWGTPSGMFCMDNVVAQVKETGWSHHITRLMVLANLATLAGFSPRELTDWFWVAYIDAYEWVVESNVLGMGTFADGGLTATKPYISGAAYINKMSNYCKHCALDPKKNLGPGSCPFTAMYWAFLERHSDLLSSNMRMKMPYATLRKKSAEERTALRERAAKAVAELGRGEVVS